MDYWLGKLNRVLASGYKELRAMKDISWVEEENWDNFQEYEKKLNGIINKNQMILLCFYRSDTCNATNIMDTVTNHQVVLAKRRGK